MTSIHRATYRDVPALLPLVKEYWDFEGITGYDARAVAVQLERLLSEPALGAGWIASVEGQPIGYLIAAYAFSLEHLGLTAEIDELFVVPSQRGRGVGADLLRAAESEFRRARCTCASLQLSERNDTGRAFYSRQGYGEWSGRDILGKSLQEGTSRDHPR